MSDKLHQLYESISDPLKELFDWASFAGIMATFLQLIPDMSAVVGLIWLCIRVWETDTVKGWRTKNGDKRVN